MAERDTLETKLTSFSDEANLFIEVFDSEEDKKLLQEVASLRRSMFLAKGVQQSVNIVQKKWQELCDSKIKKASPRIVGATIYIVGLGDQFLN